MYIYLYAPHTWVAIWHWLEKKNANTKCMNTAGLQLEATWTAYGKPRGSWQQALFLACQVPVGFWW